MRLLINGNKITERVELNYDICHVISIHLIQNTENKEIMFLLTEKS